MQRLLNFLKLFVICVSMTACPGGPSVDICVVDAPRKAFQCGNEKREWTLPMSDGEHLTCSSVLDTQQFLVNCHKGKIMDIALCNYSVKDGQFNCKDTDGLAFFVSITNADNYVCMSELHRRRVINRC